MFIKNKTRSPKIKDGVVVALIIAGIILQAIGDY